VFRDQVAQAWITALEAFRPDDELAMRIQECLMTTAPEEDNPDEVLGAALDHLAQAGTQSETLKRLIEGATRFAERGALFVIKQGIASLYAHRGFEAAHPRAGVPVVPPPALEPLVQGHGAIIDTPGPAYEALLAPLGCPKAAAARVIPLRLRRRTVALLLADSGARERLAHPNQLRALVLGAEARLSWLAAAREEERPAPAEAQPSVLTQRIPDPIAEPAQALDPVVRGNAERSARVLVSDMELYFPAKLAQGQAQGNLYAAMKDELDRSRASFVDRYGTELENQHQIFYKTVVQQLCAGDPARLGPAPWAAH
jgi:hypothetical protein